MTAEDEQAVWLRAQLDRELAGLTSRPEALQEVLAGARPEPAAARRRGPGAPPAWFVAAAAVLVVALAVPVLRDTVFAGPTSRSELATPALPPPVVPPPVPPAATPAQPVPARTSSPRPRRSTSSPTVRASTAPATTTTCGSSSSTGAADPTASFDLDGDGRPDPVSVAAGALTVQLSASGTASAPLPASPYVEVLPVRPAGTRAVQLLVLTRGPVDRIGSVGLQGRLYAAGSCSIAPVLNAGGVPYTFNVGSNADDTARSGVSCAGTSLYGVTSVRTTDGSAWNVTRTPVSSSSGRAVNAAPTTATIAVGDPAAEALRQASCGSAMPVALG